MSAREILERFLIAFSYTRKQRDIGRSIAESIDRHGGQNLFLRVDSANYSGSADSVDSITSIFSQAP